MALGCGDIHPVLACLKVKILRLKIKLPYNIIFPHLTHMDFFECLDYI